MCCFELLKPHHGGPACQARTPGDGQQHGASDHALIGIETSACSVVLEAERLSATCGEYSACYLSKSGSANVMRRSLQAGGERAKIAGGRGWGQAYLPVAHRLRKALCIASYDYTSIPFRVILLLVAGPWKSAGILCALP